MNRTKLKNYAPQARRQFIQAVTDRAAVYGLSAGEAKPITEQGDVAIIGGKAFPISVVQKRRRLEERIDRLVAAGKKPGEAFEQVMEAMAYTWFNRLVAIRFMELHGYLDHGYRVLSNPDPTKATPEIVEHAEHVDLPGLDRQLVVELKLDGTKESQLYRMLLIAQCNALHKAMPFLFERIDDETELLLPDNLLNSDSILRKLVSEIDEADWEQVEIIGWLYQFYISEKKDEVIGKVVKSEDIPAATQLFTPNWIVKYLVQNSLGRQWLATYPQSPLKAKMEFYIEPAEQTPEVQAELKRITPQSLNPEELTLMDPACGSGHILVEAYDLLKEIYLERGYRLRDIPTLILTKNLFGLEIDDRAAQLAAFALMMKARADDRRIFDGEAQPNVLAIQESNGLNVNAIVQAFTENRIPSDGLSTVEFGFTGPIPAPLFVTPSQSALAANEMLAVDLKAVLGVFNYAKTYGSLIVVPEELRERLPRLAHAADVLLQHPNMAIQQAARIARLYIGQAIVFAARFDAVVANPPYMGANGMNPLLKRFCEREQPDSKAQLYTMFLSRAMLMSRPTVGAVAMVTLDSWMFLSSYATFRQRMLRGNDLRGLVHMPYEGRGRTTMGIAFGTGAAVWWRTRVVGYRSHFCCARHWELDDDGKPLTFPPANERLGVLCCAELAAIPGQPIVYWADENARRLFGSLKNVGHFVETREGMATADNSRFLRWWHEVQYSQIGFGCRNNADAKQSQCRWFPYVKGGDYRKWYGNVGLVVNWWNDGCEVRSIVDEATGRIRSHNYNGTYGFRRGISWSGLSSSKLSVRVVDDGFMFDAKGPMAFAQSDETLDLVLAVLNSDIGFQFMKMLAPTLDFKLGHIMSVPFDPATLPADSLRANVRQCVEVCRSDWDSAETSWAFRAHPVLECREKVKASDAFSSLEGVRRNRIEQLETCESGSNLLLRNSYRFNAPSSAAERAGVTLTSWDLRWEVESLLSYATGCAMGRYSRDKPGLIYANCGNEGFDPNQYKSFPADKDGIIPVTDIDWFPDDAAHRFEEFVGVAWPKEHLEVNLKFIADSLGPKSGEQPRDTIRRYFADDFYKHHLQTYKRRPIYWLFTSGKLGAFQCLVYLHRYNDGTLARMRTEYVIPLQGKIASRIDQLEGDKAKATSAAHRKRIEKEQDLLRKHQTELRAFDEKLRHYADLRITLDLDDGVKVNYGKFGDLLACVTQVGGKAEDED